MEQPRVMSGRLMARIRREMGLSVRDLAETLRVKDVRGIIRYEKDEQPISGPVTVILEMMNRGLFPPEMVRRAPEREPRFIFNEGEYREAMRPEESSKDD